MIHFDSTGNVIGSFVAPQGHGMDTDSKGFAYLGQDTVRKYDVRTGRMVAEVPRAPEREGGGPNRPAALPQVVPGQGGQGPIAGFLPRADGTILGNFGTMGDQGRPVLRPAHGGGRFARLYIYG